MKVGVESESDCKHQAELDTLYTMEYGEKMYYVSKKLKFIKHMHYGGALAALTVIKVLFEMEENLDQMQLSPFVCRVKNGIIALMSKMERINCPINHKNVYPYNWGSPVMLKTHRILVESNLHIRINIR